MEFGSIVSWWKSVSENVLWAQLSGWERFCNWRKSCRPQLFAEPELQAYLNRLRERRRQFGLEGDVSLEAAIEDQSRLQTWMEFQDYHHRFQANIQKSNGCRDIIKGRKALLDWIEEQRKVMVTEEAPCSPPEEQFRRAAMRQDEKTLNQPRCSRNKVPAPVSADNLITRRSTRRRQQNSESSLEVSKKLRNETTTTNPGISPRRNIKRKRSESKSSSGSETRKIPQMSKTK